MRHTAFGTNVEISTPEKEAEQDRTKSDGRPHNFVKGWLDVF